MSFEALLRLDKFTKLFRVHFSGIPSEDPQDYLERCHKVLRNMGIVEINGVDFDVFQMTGSAKRWWRDYTLTRPVGSPTLSWEQLSQLFLEKFLPITLREEFHKQFERLQHGNMTVTQYESRFVDLSRHSLHLLPTDGERVRRFTEGLTHLIKLQMSKETGSEISFQVAANVARRIEMGNFGRGHPPRPFHSALHTSPAAIGSHGPIMHYYSGQPAFSAHSAPISEPPLQSYYSGYPAHLG
ncbi:uncharacterized protein [Nicotiana tomentosiformis]|uniref:uncharacterized protein n=1 Tax=Nicotiana tomentosiformis TaxID=4098 RepID=UPI00388C8AA0